MKRILGALFLCGFLLTSVAEARKVSSPKIHQSKASKRQAKEMKRQNAKARKSAKARAKARRAA